MYVDERFRMNITDSTGNFQKGSEGSRPLKCACEGDGQTKHSVLGTKVALCGDSDKER